MIIWRITNTGDAFEGAEYESLHEAEELMEDLGYEFVDEIFTGCYDEENNVEVWTKYYTEQGKDIDSYGDGYEPCIDPVYRA